MSNAQEDLQWESATVNYMKPAELNEGDVIMGVFVETKQGQFGPSYILRTDDGLIGLNGSGSLNSQFSSLMPIAGDKVKVTYGGTKILTDGAFKGKECHQFDVKVARIPRQEADA